MRLDKGALQEVTFHFHSHNRLEENLKPNMFLRIFLTMIESRVPRNVRNIILSIFSSFVETIF